MYFICFFVLIMCEFLISLFSSPTVQYAVEFVVSWLLSNLLNRLLFNKLKVEVRLPKIFSKTIKWILILLALPVNIVLFGISYPYELLFRNKCRIKITNYSYDNSWTWKLCKDNFELLTHESKPYPNKFECKRACKKSLRLRFMLFPRTEWAFTYYRVYLKKSEYDGFCKLLKDNETKLWREYSKQYWHI